MFNCLAIDIGAGSGRIMRCTISDAGKVDLTEIARFPNNSREVDGVLRWDIEALITDIKAGLAKGAAEQKPDAVAVDTWGVDYLLLDKEGNRLADPACYRDPRTVGLDAEFVERFGKERLQRLTGIQIMNINTLFQLYAESRANADYAARAEHFLFVPDYIAYRLSGEIANEFTIASTSQLLDCAKADWSDELLEAVRLPRRCVKPLTQPGTRIGTCDFSGVKGLEGVPCVMVGSHDTASGVAAAPAVGEKNWAYIASGTWCLTGIESPKALATPRAAELNFTNEGGVAHTYRVLKNLTGFWILRGLKEDVAKELSYDRMMEEAVRARKFRCFYNPNHPLFFNPESMKDAVDEFMRKSGQVLPETPAEYIETFLESLALLFRRTIAEADSISGKKTEVIHLMGGGAQNPVLCQYTADATGCTVMAGPVEATAIGNAMLQAIAVGKLDSVASARRLIRSSFEPDVYTPRRDCAGQWEDAAVRFAEIMKI